MWRNPADRALRVFGELHAESDQPSSTQVVLVGEPVVAHAKVAVREVVTDGGTLVNCRVGAAVVPPLELDVTCQVNVADAEPAEFATVTLNECAPTESAL